MNHIKSNGIAYFNQNSTYLHSILALSANMYTYINAYYVLLMLLLLLISMYLVAVTFYCFTLINKIAQYIQYGRVIHRLMLILYRFAHISVQAQNVLSLLLESKNMSGYISEHSTCR